MKIHKRSFLLTFLTVIFFTGCTVNFVGKTPTTSTDIRFITGNEDISKNDYEVKGVVVVQRQITYFDLFGLIKPPNDALSEVFTDDIAKDLTQKALELGANTITDMEIVSFSVLPGGIFYLVPIGSATVVMQATAINVK